MSIQYPYSIGKVPNIFRFETVFHELASDCTKLTLSINKRLFSGTVKPPFVYQ